MAEKSSYNARLMPQSCYGTFSYYLQEYIIENPSALCLHHKEYSEFNYNINEILLSSLLPSNDESP